MNRKLMRSEIVLRKPKFQLIFIIFGYLIIYSALELTAKLTGDPVKTENALIVTLSVLVCTISVEFLLFNKNFSEILKAIGLGKPNFKAVSFSVVIALLLFLCYPFISSITGYRFVLPEKWLWLAIGVFALHGAAEEILYRGFLFRHLREKRSFLKASWLAVIFFTAAHIPIMLNQGLLVGGMAVLLAVVSSFPLSFLYERGNNTIWAPAIVHFAIDTVIPILAYGPAENSSTFAVTLWMISCMIIPYSAFIFLKKT